jgi:outer membrane protein OmpA-like peptidoglycan-associated protein
MSKSIEQAPIMGAVTTGRIDSSAQAGMQPSRFSPRAGIIAGTAIGVLLVGALVYLWSARSPSMPENRPTAPDAGPSLSVPLPDAPTPQSTSSNTAATSAPTSKAPLHADIYFDFGKSRLTAEAAAVLQRQAGILKEGGTWAILIQGYTDQYGPVAYNKALALRRGETVKRFMVELGIPESSMRVVALGKDGALCDEQSSSCRRLNRRVHLEMVKLDRAETVAEPSAAQEPLIGTRPDSAVGDSATVVPQGPGDSAAVPYSGE